jgi:hypothetical protein
LQPGECWAGDVAGHELSDGYLHPETIKIFTPLSFTERWKTLALRPAPEEVMSLSRLSGETLFG